MGARICDYCHKPIEGKTHGLQRYHAGECRKMAYRRLTAKWLKAHPWKTRVKPQMAHNGAAIPLEEYKCHVPGGISGTHWQTAGCW